MTHDAHIQAWKLHRAIQTLGDRHVLSPQYRGKHRYKEQTANLDRALRRRAAVEIKQLERA